MGGWGSGAWQTGKSKTSSHWALDVRLLAREDLLTPGKGFRWDWSSGEGVIGSIQIRVGEGRVTLNYSARDPSENWQQLDYPVTLDWTACGLGGQRAWFLCPARDCGRRVAILYGGIVFACRRCHRLAYDSQSEQQADRFTRRAQKIRRRLGWRQDMLNSGGDKPKGMHWRTFERLQGAHDLFAEASFSCRMGRFGMLAHA